MDIKSAEFVKGVIIGKEFWDKNKPQFVFYGRSNSGKSSSINAILNRNSLARPSGTPGKTREINFYDINNEFYFVDLPGYGYAKMSKVEQEKLRQLILWFVDETEVASRTHVVVMDSKIGMTNLDREMLEILESSHSGKVIGLLNKVDRLNQKELSASLKKAKEEIPPFVELIPFSAVKKTGVDKFWEIIKK